MNISPGTVVPPALVLAVAGWSCWTILGATTTPPASPKPKPAESVAALLEPALGASAERDPFALPNEPEPKAKAAPVSAAKAAESPEAKGRRVLEALKAKLATRLAAARAAEARRLAARDRLAHLPLTATSVHAAHRVAMIGGRAYIEGETIDGTEASIGPVVLAEIRPREVTVRSSVGPVAVRFTEKPMNAGSSAAAPPPAAATAGAGKRPKSTGGVVTMRGKAR